MSERYKSLCRQAGESAKAGDIGGAMSVYKKAIELEPNLPGAYYALGVLLHGEKKTDEAIVHFEKTAQITPEDYTIWNNLGVLYYSADQLEKAERAYKTTLQSNPRHIDAWYGLGRVLFKLGKIEDASNAVHHCLRWEPRYKKATQLLKDLPARDPKRVHKTLRVGFISIWFERGQAYVTKIIRDVFQRHHETFVFARTGGVYDQPMLETQGQWNIPNLTTFNEYRIPGDVIQTWIRDNELDVVVFNEEYDWTLVKAVKSTGVKTLTYLDYYKDDWKPYMGMYDAVFCSTFRSFEMMRQVSEAYYMGWAVDTDLFHPRNNGEKKFTFFHNAGWLGINYRKMTPAVILAFDAISSHFPDASLLVHAQAGLEKLPAQVVTIIEKNPKIEYRIETLPAPGLYHEGMIHVFPTKLEGLGLPLFEGLAAGLPAITTDAPPMNEFIQDNENGVLVPVAHSFTRRDNIAFPETVVDINALARKMAELASDPDKIKKLSENARTYALTELHLDRLSDRIEAILGELYDPTPGVANE